MNGEGSGQGLIIIAAVIIAFVNWLSNTLKERAEQKEAAKRRERRLADGDHGKPAPEEAWPQQETATGPRQADPSQQLRDFFESLSGNAPPPPPPEPVVVAPPVQLPPTRAEEPSRWKAPEVKRANLSAEERQALARIAAVRPKSRARRPGQHSIIDRLRTPDAAQEAVILAEILGKPKALAD